MLSVLLISFYLLVQGIPAIGKIGVFEFLLGLKWFPAGEKFGLAPMIIGSLYATLGAILIGVPIGVLTAVYLAQVAPNWAVSLIKPAVELLAGIPSVVYGFFGLVVIVPIIDSTLGGGGNSLLAAIIILSIMILPTIISISEAAIKAVPNTFLEGSLALGATHIESIFKVILPAAKSGVLAAVVLGIGRAVGETMAVIMVMGNSPVIPTSLLDRCRTMTANIAMEMAEASGLHAQALFATGVILFIFIMLLNILLNALTNKAGEK